MTFTTKAPGDRKKGGLGCLPIAVIAVVVIGLLIFLGARNGGGNAAPSAASGSSGSPTVVASIAENSFTALDDSFSLTVPASWLDVYTTPPTELRESMRSDVTLHGTWFTPGQYPVVLSVDHAGNQSAGDIAASAVAASRDVYPDLTFTRDEAWSTALGYSGWWTDFTATADGDAIAVTQVVLVVEERAVFVTLTSPIGKDELREELATALDSFVATGESWSSELGTAQLGQLSIGNLDRWVEQATGSTAQEQGLDALAIWSPREGAVEDTWILLTGFEDASAGDDLRGAFEHSLTGLTAAWDQADPWTITEGQTDQGYTVLRAYVAGSIGGNVLESEQLIIEHDGYVILVGLSSRSGIAPWEADFNAIVDSIIINQ